MRPELLFLLAGRMAGASFVMMENPLKICMVCYSFYETDNRVRRYSEFLTTHGHQVDVLSLRMGEERFPESINGVRVYRLQRRIVNEKGKFSYLFKILAFFLKAFMTINLLFLKKRYDVVHVHNVPDFLVFAAIIPKLFGSKIILDIHDILPEFYINKFSKTESSFVFKVLLWIERISINFSDHVIISNHLWYEKLLKRDVPKNKLSVIMNYPDPRHFYSRNLEKEKNKIILVYPGTLNYHQGLDLAIKAFSKVKDKIPTAEFHIYGEGRDRKILGELVSELGLDTRVLFKGRLPTDKLAIEVSKADIGVVPKRDDNFGGEAFSTKILEFMIMGIPAIVSATRIDQYYFNDSIVRFFKPSDIDDLSKAMARLVLDEGERTRLSKNASEYVKDMNWGVRQKEYFEILENLVTA